MVLPGEEKYHNDGFDVDQLSTLVAKKVYQMYQLDFTPVVEAYEELKTTIENLKLRVEAIENDKHIR